MKLPFVCLFATILAMCTTVYERGQKIASIGSDVDHFYMKTPAGTVVSAARINNGSVHRAIGAAVGQGAAGIGTGVATSGILNVVK